jgi:AbiV family abortive infection protein
MSKHDDRGPKPADLLFNNLFADPQPAEVCKLLAGGIDGAWRNADRLLSDARALVEDGRLSSARFLITTAREELAKAPLLLDACMLDFSKHRSTLQRLCQAFYDHVAKYVYIELLEETLTDSMDRAGKFWKIAVTRWWPGGGPEDGEPDMPHATHFDREFPLYVNFGDWERRWLVPDDSRQRSRFNWRPDPVTKAEQLIEPWREADAAGLCAPQVLEIINSVFRAKYIREDAPNAELHGLFTVVERRVCDEVGISAEAFKASPLFRFPLYHFVSQGW